jgi:hypothetical protein
MLRKFWKLFPPEFSKNMPLRVEFSWVENLIFDLTVFKSDGVIAAYASIWYNDDMTGKQCDAESLRFQAKTKNFYNNLFVIYENNIFYVVFLRGNFFLRKITLKNIRFYNQFASIMM